MLPLRFFPFTTPHTMALLQDTLLSNCTSRAIPFPSIDGAQILSMNANVVLNHSVFAPAMYNFNHPDIRGDNLSYCNLTVTHTHPGQNDTILSKIWLPLRPTWN